VIIRTLITTM